MDRRLASRRARFGVLLTVAGLAVGCGAGAAGPTDGGAAAADAAGEAAMDAGRADDAAAPPPADAGTTPPDASDGGGCPPAAGSLILYAIPPPSSLDWSSPNTLLNTAAVSAAAGSALTGTGAAVLSHEIGHVNLELDCGGASIPLTGQTGGGQEWVSGADGIGILFRDYPGALNETADAIGANADTVADIAARQASGNLTRIKFVVNQQLCQRLSDFHAQYIATLAYTHYDALARPRRFQGAGCAIFGAGVVDVGGLLRRSLVTPAWARTMFVGSARFANNGGVHPFYPYGSELVAQDATGVDWIWPAGVNVPASQLDVIVMESATMKAWTGPEDAPFDIPGVTLAGPMATAVPFTIYDPQLVVAWAEQVWSEANASGSAVSLEATWTAATVQAVHEITYDAHCVMPQTLPFASDNDDLFKDSDAP